MVSRALSAVLALALVSIASPAAAQLDLTLPDCAPTHIDVALLRELLRIELADAPMAMTIGSSLCDGSARAIDVDVRNAEGARARESIEVDTSDDPHAAARSIALAIAGRAPHMRAVLVSPPPPPDPPPPPEPRAPRDPASALASPTGSLSLSPALPPSPSPALPVSPALPPTFGISLRGRLLPVLPSWALGLRLDVGASLDPTWSLRGELFSTWSRATAFEGDIDAVVLGGAGLLGASVYRTPSIELVVGARAELGALFAMGWVSGGSAGAPTTHAWATAGGELDLLVRLDARLALAFDLGVSAVLAGTRLVSWPSGTQIDYSIVTIDLGAGLRFAL